jgi:hypothetical protein
VPLTERDLETRQVCEAHDMIANAEQGGRHASATLFEHQLNAEMGRLPAPFQIEDEIRAEQMATKGVVIASPDLLFAEPIRVGGALVAWVDAKNFYGSGLDSMAWDIQKQVDKYADIWGPGMIVFALGCPPPHPTHTRHPPLWF